MESAKPIVIALLLISFNAHADYFYLRAGVGFNESLFAEDKSLVWEDRGSMGCTLGAGYRHQIKDNWHGDLNYTHVSQCFVGPPFDDRSESTVDHIGYAVEYRF